MSNKLKSDLSEMPEEARSPGHVGTIDSVCGHERLAVLQRFPCQQPPGPTPPTGSLQSKHGLLFEAMLKIVLNV